MCGRYLLNADPDLLAQIFGVQEISQTPRDRPRYNVAPSQPVPIVREAGSGEARGREFATARWGLVPAWAKDPAIGNKLINARAETAAEKPAFRAAFAARRAIIPASGFYEWRRHGAGGRQPYLIHRRDGAPMGLAGLWETWRDRADGTRLLSCTILTCPANGLLADLHDRMPVILDPAGFDRWLDPSDPDPVGLFRPLADHLLELRPVSPRVNSPRNDDPAILQPQPQPQPQAELF